MINQIKSVDQFFGKATQLRKCFEQNFANPHNAHRQRFVWDYWHVPNQYNLLRTPAWTYFPKGLYRQFHRHLVVWGREQLGCHDISPPWLSFYVDGCFQNLHADGPHGPWAFVYSLTQWQKRKFSGGTTQILKPSVLNYWQNYDRYKVTEQSQLITEVAPQFNRLIVFDPRIPHGVSPVSGVLDPQEGRLVIHGWFVQPRLFVQGPLLPKVVDEVVRGFLTSRSQSQQSLLTSTTGTLSLRLSVSARGQVRQIKILTNSLMSKRKGNYSALMLKALLSEVKNLKFPQKSKPSQVTLPLIIE